MNKKKLSSSIAITVLLSSPLTYSDTTNNKAISSEQNSHASTSGANNSGPNGYLDSNNDATAHIKKTKTFFIISPEDEEYSSVDYSNAKPTPLPTSSVIPINFSDVIANSTVTTESQEDKVIIVEGSTGSGKMEEVRLIPKKLLNKDKKENHTDFSHSLQTQDAISQEYGQAQHPFTTSRVDAYARVSKFYPYRASGKLFYKNGSNSFVCSASLIRPGVVVTAAHCIVDNESKTVGRAFRFIPAYYNGTAPYGEWRAREIIVSNNYFSGRSCDKSGVVCSDDIGILLLQHKINPNRKPYYAGNIAGWFGYAVNGFGFTYGYLGSSLTHITQLGYPASHDNGEKMQRNDSFGYIDRYAYANTIIGSRMTGGSSGGPWIANFGGGANLKGTSYGINAERNRIIGVASWGSNNSKIKKQGASPFTSSNFLSLLRKICPPRKAGC